MSHLNSFKMSEITRNYTRNSHSQKFTEIHIAFKAVKNDHNESTKGFIGIYFNGFHIFIPIYSYLERLDIKLYMSLLKSLKYSEHTIYYT